VRSVQRLTEYSFEWVLPGHGERVWLPAEEMRGQLDKLIEAVACY
jgi:glyoxylase-like metal-dependent hydrolase (beta-lactamase superfamily II)